MNFFDKIRRKPESARSRYALFLSGLVTGIIFIFWILVWRELEVSNRPVNPNEKNPLQSLNEVFSGGFDQFKEKFGGASSTWADFTKNIDGFMASSTATSTATTTATTTNSTTTVAQ